MKKYAIFTTVLALCAITALAQGETTRTVTVVGSASTEIVPDNDTWNLTVIVKDDDQEKLRNKADEILSQVKAAAGRLGIDNDEMIFGKVMINMRYKQKNRRESHELSHYELSQRITLNQADIHQYDEFWYELTAIEGVMVSQDFRTSQLESTTRQIRIDALHAAKQKAEDFAAVVGDSVGRAISISEFKPNPTQADIDHVAYLMSAPGFGRPEKIEVSAQVYVVFELK